MLKQKQIDQLATQIRTMQIIAAALILGVFVATGVISAIVDWGTVNVNLEILVIFGLLFMVGSIVAAFVIPIVLANSGAVQQGSTMPVPAGADPDIHRLGGMFQTLMIVRLAIIEGACFANLMFFMLEQSLLNLAAVSLGLLVLASLFPTLGRLIAFVEDNQ